VNSVSKASWRNGRVFRYGEKNGRSGWFDERERLWHWDISHIGGHWDVELDDGTNINVSISGDIF
jgi:hypothetical protein